MATVYKLLQDPQSFYDELQERNDLAAAKKHERFQAVLMLQRLTRGYLLRKHLAWLSHNATIIQCAYRKRRAKKAFRAALRRAVQQQHGKYYAVAATKIQALWRGHYSRKTKFNYYAYRHWLQTVTERGERRTAEAAEFAIRSRVDDLKILEDEARQWLAFVAFKLHHLLRTYSSAGIYSTLGTTELSDFEQLLASIRYTDYMKRLRRKYEEFVKKHKPQFSNKRLFPIIGEGRDYWYMTLPEMYEISFPTKVDTTREKQRHSDTHHGKIHDQPFLWKKFRLPLQEGRGPFTPPQHRIPKMPICMCVPPAPAPTPTPGGDAEPRKDPRFSLYVKYYKPNPEVMEYIDYHINCVLKRRCEINLIKLQDDPPEVCRPNTFTSNEQASFGSK